MASRAEGVDLMKFPGGDGEARLEEEDVLFRYHSYYEHWWAVVGRATADDGQTGGIARDEPLSQVMTPPGRYLQAMTLWRRWRDGRLLCALSAGITP